MIKDTGLAQNAELSPSNALGIQTTTSSRSISSMRVSTAERPGVALLRYFLFPLTTVACLLIVAAAFAQPITRPYVILAVLAFALSWRLVDAAEFRELRPLGTIRHVLPSLLLAWTNVLAVLLFVGFAAKISDSYSRAVIMTWAIATPVLYIFARAVAYRVLCHWNKTRCVPRTHIIVGTNSSAREFASQLEQDSSLGTLIGFFSTASRATETSLHRPGIGQLLGCIDDVVAYVQRHSIDVVHVALPAVDRELLDAALNQLRDTTASVYFLPDVPQAARGQVRVVEMAGTPLLSYVDTPHCGLQGAAKRATDLIIGGILLLFLWPLFIVLAILVRLDSPGPIIFKQRRYGLNGEEIAVYKFRTMTVCEDGAQVTQAKREDARVTSFGRFLRRTSLDELPQLFCVLEGSMSLVGPRPHAVAHNEMYRRLIDGYMLRHKVRPGITGWAQVNGLRGETNTLDRMQKRVAFDLEYLRHWSPWVDIQILWRTVFVVFRDQNAY
jgi:putative colanic acid biosynthesis UDP-glucose lipid carrier transferase